MIAFSKNLGPKAHVLDNMNQKIYCVAKIAHVGLFCEFSSGAHFGTLFGDCQSVRVIGGGRGLSVLQSAAVMDFAFLQLKSLQATSEIWNLPPESFVMSVGATNEPEAVNRVGFLPFLVLSARSLNCSPDPLDAKNPTRAITLSLSCPLSHWKDPTTTTTDAKTVVHLIIFWRLQMCRLFYAQSTIGVNIVDILE